MRQKRWWQAVLYATAIVWASTVAPSALAFTAVVTIGQDLTPAERARVLAELGVGRLPVRQLVISNVQEHHLLDGIAPAREIGTRAISSAYVVPQRWGYGIRVATRNITWVTPGMYRNALVTAGVRDAIVRVAAPFPVSGTAALAGIMWAYQAATGRALKPDQERVAAREMVATSEIAHSTGNPGATVTLFQDVKQQVVAKHFTTPAQIRPVVLRVAAELHLTLTAAQVDQVTGIMVDISRFHLSPNTLVTEVGAVQHEAVQWEGFWQALVAFFERLWHQLFGGATGALVDGRGPHSLDSLRYRP